MNIYYVEVEFNNMQHYIKSGVHHRLNLVIAESEKQAVQIMKSLLSEYAVSVSIPKEADILVGHGSDVTAYLTDPQNNQNYRDLLDSYKNKYQRYELQIFNSRGEILMQNQYTQLPEESDTTADAVNVFVAIPPEKVDTFYTGIAFVCDNEDSNNIRSYIVLAEQHINDDSSFTATQTAVCPDGSILIRNRVVDGTWSSWTGSSSSASGSELIANRLSGVSFDDAATTPSVDNLHYPTALQSYEWAKAAYDKAQAAGTLARLPSFDAFPAIGKDGALYLDLELHTLYYYDGASMSYEPILTGDGSFDDCSIEAVTNILESSIISGGNAAR